MNRDALSRQMPALFAALSMVAIGACGAASQATPSAVPSAIAAATATAAAVVSPSGSHAPVAPLSGACAGPNGADLTGIPEVARLYLSAWNEREDQARLAALDNIWAVDAIYFDALSVQPAVGRLEMARLMGELQGPVGSYFEPREWFDGDEHHGRLRLAWRHCGPDGPTGVEGTEYVELGGDGRVARAVGFSPLSPETSVVTSGKSSDVCTGAGSFQWSSVPNVVKEWAFAWNAPDESSRRLILDRLWADDGTYVASYDDDPVATLSDLHFMMDYGMATGNYIELSASDASELHAGWFHARWRDCCPNGSVLLEGTDVGEIGEDGRLIQVISFWEERLHCQADECPCGD